MSACQDLYNHMEQASAFDFAVISSDTTTTGNIIDTTGFNSITFLLAASAYTDGAYAMTLTEGDDSGLSDGATVESKFIIGDASTISVGAANTPKRLGYVGKKRYVRLNIVSTATTTGATLGATVIKGHAKEVASVNN